MSCENRINHFYPMATESYDNKERLSQILAAIEKDDVPNLCEALEVVDLFDLKLDNMPALLYAAASGSANSFRHIYDNGVSLDVRDEHLRTCAHCAAAGGRVEILSFLLSEGYPVTTVQDEDGNLPIHYAARHDKIDAFRWFWANGVAIDATNNKGWQPIHFAAMGNACSVVEFLLENGIPVDATAQTNMTPLLCACKNMAPESTAEVLELLIKAGANLNIEDSSKPSSLLFIAATGGRSHVCRILLDHGADLNQQDEMGWTALTVAIKTKSLATVKELLSRKILVNTSDHYQMRPIHWAAKFGLFEILQELVRAGAEVGTKSSEGWTALHLAAGYGHRDCCEFLIAQGCSVKDCDLKGISPFMFACLNGNDDIARYLAECGADTKIVDQTGWNCIHWAASNDHPSTCEYLVGIGVDVNARNSKGQTPLDLADQYRCTRAIEVLERLGATNGNTKMCNVC